YRESGGNPFYLEQLARSPARASQFTSAPEISLTGLDVPAAVAAALAEELTLLSEVGRLVLEGPAVAGDPFEPELAAAAAGTSEAAAMHGVDELLRRDLIRTTDVPRRFRFRHPLVRRAVYQAAAGGWRLGAHERCAEALAARGASAAARAHHVERSARQGDLAAVAVLREAGEAKHASPPKARHGGSVGRCGSSHRPRPRKTTLGFCSPVAGHWRQRAVSPTVIRRRWRQRHSSRDGP